MSNGPIEAVCETIFSGVASITGDPGRALSPYYEYDKYGQRTFETNEGTTPQVRVRRNGFSTSEAQSGGGFLFGQAAPYTSQSGSIATFNQDLEFKIWGRDEQQCFDEYQYICQSIKKLQSINPENLSQPSFIGEQGNWPIIDSHDVFGELLTFNYTVSISIPERPTSIAFVSRSILYVSASTAYNSASYEGAYKITLTSSI